MVRGIRLSKPEIDSDSVVKLRLKIDRSTPDSRLMVSGFCIAAKDFGDAPKLCLVRGEEEDFIEFSSKATPRKADRFKEVSLNAKACRFPEIEVAEYNLPMKLKLVSEDGKKRISLAQFDYDPIDRLYDKLYRQVESKKTDTVTIEEELAELPESVQSTENGLLLKSVIAAIKNRYEGTAESEMLAIRKQYVRHRRFPDYPHYLKLLNKAIEPWRFGMHGIAVNFSDFDDGVEFWDNLRSFLEFLTNEVGPSFVVSGTLLGLVREHRLLPHDNDLDIAVLLGASNADEAARMWVDVKKDLRRRGMLNENLLEMTLVPIIKPIRISGIPCDLFPAWIEGDRVFVYPHTFGELHKSDVLPLGFDETHSLPIPRNPAKMLEVNYGSGWKVPDPSAKLDWPTWRRNFREFRRSRAFKEW